MCWCHVTVIVTQALLQLDMHLGNDARHLFGLGKVASNWKNLACNEHSTHTTGIQIKKMKRMKTR